MLPRRCCSLWRRPQCRLLRQRGRRRPASCRSSGSPEANIIRILIIISCTTAAAPAAQEPGPHLLSAAIAWRDQRERGHERPSCCSRAGRERRAGLILCSCSRPLRFSGSSRPRGISADYPQDVGSRTLPPTWGPDVLCVCVCACVWACSRLSRKMCVRRIEGVRLPCDRPAPSGAPGIKDALRRATASHLAWN